MADMGDAELVPARSPQTSVGAADGQTDATAGTNTSNVPSKANNDNHLTVARKDSMEDDRAPEMSHSAAEYKSRIDDIKEHIKAQQKKNLENAKKKELVFGPAVIWYLAKRYHAVDHLTWSQYIRHFLPYPFITLAVTLLQILSLALIYQDTFDPEEEIDTKTDNVELLFARLSALSILTAYILMTGRNIQNFIHVIAFDAILQQTKCFYIYILLPVVQGLVEAIAIFISAVVILTSDTVIDVFKDVVAIMFLLEIDQWMAAALNMMDLGLSADSLVIDFEYDESNLDELITIIVYGSLLFVRFGIISWAVFLTIYGTFGDAEDVGGN